MWTKVHWGHFWLPYNFYWLLFLFFFVKYQLNEGCHLFSVNENDFLSSTEMNRCSYSGKN